VPGGQALKSKEQIFVQFTLLIGAADENMPIPTYSCESSANHGTREQGKKKKGTVRSKLS
jgi:hypothetical protein